MCQVPCQPSPAAGANPIVLPLRYPCATPVLPLCYPCAAPRLPLGYRNICATPGPAQGYLEDCPLPPPLPPLCYPCCHLIPLQDTTTLYKGHACHGLLPVLSLLSFNPPAGYHNAVQGLRPSWILWPSSCAGLHHGGLHDLLHIEGQMKHACITQLWLVEMQAVSCICSCPHHRQQTSGRMKRWKGFPIFFLFSGSCTQLCLSTAFLCSSFSFVDDTLV